MRLAWRTPGENVVGAREISRRIEGSRNVLVTVTDMSTCSLNLRERGPVCRPAKPQMRKTLRFANNDWQSPCSLETHPQLCALGSLSVSTTYHKTLSPREGPPEDTLSSGCVSAILLYTSHLFFESFCLTQRFWFLKKD